MSSVNKVIILGRLGKDPEIKDANGTKLATMSVATSEKWKDKNSGERKERTEWHRVVIFNEKLAEIAEKYLRKGSQVYLEGQLTTRKWTDKAGVERYTTEVVVPKFGGAIVLLTSAGDTQGGTTAASKPAAGAKTQAELDDEIPF